MTQRLEDIYLTASGVARRLGGFRDTVRRPARRGEVRMVSRTRGGYSRFNPTAAEPTVAEPTVAEPTAAEPTVAEPTAAEPTVVEAGAARLAAWSPRPVNGDMPPQPLAEASPDA